MCNRGFMGFMIFIYNPIVYIVSFSFLPRFLPIHKTTPPWFYRGFIWFYGGFMGAFLTHYTKT